MKCPCGLRFRCLETRPTKAGTRRRYACTCGRRASTLEVLLQSDSAALEVGKPYRHGLKATLERKVLRAAGSQLGSVFPFGVQNTDGEQR